MTNIHLIRVDLQLDEPWCIGAPERSSSPGRLPTATDPFGHVVVPSSSIAGSLRHHLTHHTDLDIVAVMGGDDDTTDGLTPSTLRVLGVEVRLPADRKVMQRTQTAIDPHRGAAFNHMLRTSEMAPPETTIRVDLRIDGDHTWYGDLLLAMTTWAPFIGRARTSGMGAAHVTAVRHGSLNLTTSDDLQQWLTSGGPDLVGRVAVQALPVAAVSRPTERVPLGHPLRWSSRDALLVGGESSGSVRKPYERHGQLVIEGSSWKGVLRSRVGFVARTLGVTTCDEPTGCSESHCPICLLFGSTTRRGRLRTQATTLRPERTVTRNHVAIDRFTGGSAEHLLFSDQDLPMNATMELDLRWLDEKQPSWVRPLVAAALLDVHDGYVGIGSKTTSGYGTVCLEPQVAEQLRSLLAHDGGAWINEIEAWQRDPHTANEVTP